MSNLYATGSCKWLSFARSVSWYHEGKLELLYAALTTRPLECLQRKARNSATWEVCYIHLCLASLLAFLNLHFATCEFLEELTHQVYFLFYTFLCLCRIGFGIRLPRTERQGECEESLNPGMLWREHSRDEEGEDEQREKAQESPLG